MRRRWTRAAVVTLASIAGAMLVSGGALATPPGKASLYAPATSSDEDPTFIFSAVGGSTWYYLWVSGDAGAVHRKWYRASDISCDSNGCRIDPGLDLAKGHYKWWIQTWNADGEGPWSDRGDFDVDHDITMPGAPFHAVLWLDHLAFEPGTPSVATSFDALDSGVGAGASGLVVEAAPGPSPYLVEQGLAVPPGLLVDGVRVCYELSNSQSTISAIRIEQLLDPPDATKVLLADASGATAMGPVCVDSAQPPDPIDPADGSLRLQLAFDFPDPDAGDRIVVRGVGLHVVADPDGPVQKEIAILKYRLHKLEDELEGHTHTYLTGKGVGHNNTTATTGPPIQP